MSELERDLHPESIEERRAQPQLPEKCAERPRRQLVMMRNDFSTFSLDLDSVWEGERLTQCEKDYRAREQMPRLYEIGVLFTRAHYEGWEGADERVRMLGPEGRRARFEYYYGHRLAVDLWLHRRTYPRPPLKIPKDTPVEEMIRLGEQWVEEHPSEAAWWVRDVNFLYSRRRDKEQANREYRNRLRGYIR